jgi:hypothetical protein
MTAVFHHLRISHNRLTSIETKEGPRSMGPFPVLS